VGSEDDINTFVCNLGLVAGVCILGLVVTFECALILGLVVAIMFVFVFVFAFIFAFAFAFALVATTSLVSEISTER
jgi:hypothetical protein